MDATIRNATTRDATMRRSRRRWRIVLVIAAAGLGGMAAVDAYAVGPVSANASTTEPARLLAVVVADNGVEFTIVDR